MSAPASDPPFRQIRAAFTDRTIRVYQAYSPEIAAPALAAQRFRPPFKRERMTWIKPSFTWMMYRSGWAMKPGQERILAIDLSRHGFEWALAHSSASHFDPALNASPDEWKFQLAASPVRIQWDPERTLQLEPLPWRAIQIGLGGDAVDAYVDEWIVKIEDVTELANEIRASLGRKEEARAAALRPVEVAYPLPPEIGHRIGCAVSELGSNSRH